MVGSAEPCQCCHSLHQCSWGYRRGAPAPDLPACSSPNTYWVQCRLNSTGGCICLPDSTTFCILHFLLKSCSKCLLLLSFQDTTDQDSNHNLMGPKLFPFCPATYQNSEENCPLLFPGHSGMPHMPRRVPFPTCTLLPQPPAPLGPGVSLQKEMKGISISLRWKKQLIPLPAKCKPQPW